MTALSSPAGVEFELFDDTPGSGLSLAEAYELLTRDFTYTQLITASAQAHSGAMIALVPSDADAARLAAPDGEDSEQLHVTLYYLGETADIPTAVRSRLIELAHTLVRTRTRGAEQVVGEGFAVSVFNPPGYTQADGKDRSSCVALLVSGSPLDWARDLVDDLMTTVGVTSSWVPPEQHRPWIPHITLAYTAEAEVALSLLDRVGPVTFDRLRLAFAGRNIDIPLIPNA